MSMARTAVRTASSWRSRCAAYRRVIKRRRYRCSCQCELAQQPKLPEACAKVLRSLRNHWQGLTLFVENPDLPMDNNQAERARVRPGARAKNYYGSQGSVDGELSATLFRLFDMPRLADRPAVPAGPSICTPG